MQLSKSSFLFSWAQFGGIPSYSAYTDTCTLLRAMLLKGPLKFLALTLAGVIVVGLLIVAPIIGLTLWFTTGWLFSELFLVLAVACAVATLIGILFGVVRLYEYLSDSNFKAVEMMRDSYKAWDNKHCHIVYLED